MERELRTTAAQREQVMMHLPRRLTAYGTAVAMLSALPLLGAAHAEAATAPAAAQPKAMTSSGETYKVMTYNVQGLPWPWFEQPAHYGMNEDVRADKISEKILADNYDIIAINEGFDGDMKTAFLQKLFSTYPYYITNMEGNSGVEQDSGLMLFSKFPIENLAEKESGDDTCVDAPEDDQCKGFFRWYEDSAGKDDWSHKGAGYIRINNPVTHRPLDLYITHTQAYNGADQVAAREKQMADLADFIEDTHDPVNRDSIIMGDLNVSSDQEPGSHTHSQEYIHTMNTYFSPLGYIDTRDYLSREDRQYSFSDQNTQNAGGDAQDGSKDERLDYILFRQAENTQDAPSCVQQSWLQKQMYFRGTVNDEVVATDLSDHYGLAAVIGRDGQLCAPYRAKANPADGNHFGSIAHQGSYQWYRFEPGAYRFRTLADNNAPMRLSAFYADDLGTPLTPWEGTENLPSNDYSVTFAPNKPFYVRVSAGNNPSWTGDYRLTVEKLTGRTKSDAIPIDPYQKLDANQMATGTTSPMSKVWYTYKQHALHSGAKQNLSFQTSEQSVGLKLNIQALDPTGAPFSPNRQSTGTTGTNRLDLTKADSPISGAEQKLYFTVNREGSTLGSFKIERTTDYRFAQFGQFWVADQQDPLFDDGDDEPWMRTWVDGSASGITDSFGDMDERQTKDAPAWMANGFGFADHFTVNMWEADEEDANEDMGTVTVQAPAAGTETRSHLSFIIPDDAEWYYYYKVTGMFDE
ncbi:endonuclease/exonuclease/phosphatase family protein [Streptomyces sp. NPDC015492]|uniref:endonuclease/exonuclease/phosphatase family protein n=1 Tax=Streptomyces sp. NPDC015492 TaxID=3364958 RepID=UPI0036F4DDCA